MAAEWDITWTVVGQAAYAQPRRTSIVGGDSGCAATADVSVSDSLVSRCDHWPPWPMGGLAGRPLRHRTAEAGAGVGAAREGGELQGGA